MRLASNLLILFGSIGLTFSLGILIPQYGKAAIRILARAFSGLAIVALSPLMIDPFDYTDETNETPAEIWREVFGPGWWR